MKRQVSLEDISDGRLYKANDMAKTGCGGCRGCSSCCHGMGNSVILDPMDIYRMTTGLSQSFEQLMAGKLELNVVDGIILPNLKMKEGNETCPFLNEEGRCSIHGLRPGICRLFPLGRYYEKRSFQYFLQIHECPYPNKTKVKISKWLEIPEIEKYEQYINSWHYFLEDVQEIIDHASEETVKNANMYILKLFYLTPYTQEDFYPQFDIRLQQAKQVFQLG